MQMVCCILGAIWYIVYRLIGIIYCYNMKPLKNPIIVIASEASRLRQHTPPKRLRRPGSSLSGLRSHFGGVGWLRRLKAISKHVDNPQDCHVALLLAMTKIKQNGGCAKLLIF